MRKKHDLEHLLNTLRQNEKSKISNRYPSLKERTGEAIKNQQTAFSAKTERKFNIFMYLLQ
ncbi:hypothetical protein OA88_14410 [Flavobacterium sp. JRM]|nr:hypothetical protein OA88_14410 [Flavobacterium sp. JRM]